MSVLILQCKEGTGGRECIFPLKEYICHVPELALGTFKLFIVEVFKLRMPLPVLSQ